MVEQTEFYGRVYQALLKSLAKERPVTPVDKVWAQDRAYAISEEMRRQGLFKSRYQEPTGQPPLATSPAAPGSAPAE